MRLSVQRYVNSLLTVAGIVRDTVSEFLKKNRRADWADDPLWNMVGAGASKDGNLSVDHDKYLYEKNK